jgi:peroxiredoxin
MFRQAQDHVPLPAKQGHSHLGWALAVLAAMLLCVTALLASAEKRGESSVSAAALNKAMATHELVALDGSELSWSSLQGEVVVVCFWASWCKPCQREMPALDALHTELVARGGRVVAISVDSDPENIRRFAKRHELDLPLYHDGPEGLAHSLELPHIPYTMVLDRNGEIALTTIGAEDEQLEQLASVSRKLAATRPLATAVAEGEE